MALQVLHLSTYDANGGAARAAYSLHRALLAHGVTSRMRVGIKHSGDPTVVQGNSRKFTVSSLLDRQLWRTQRSPRTTWRSPARFSSISASEINSSGADVVNLHWITDGFISVEEIGKIEIPIVWSMYDMWPFSGSEHYGIDTPHARWKAGYTKANRPSDEHGIDLDRWTYERKQRNWFPNRTSIHMVPASTWLEDAARSSALIGNSPIIRIPHVVNTNVFTSMDRSLARTLLNIPQNVPVVLFLASAGVSDQRKGWDLLEPALRELRRAYHDLNVIVAGPTPEPVVQWRASTRTSAVIHWVGVVKNDEDLRTLYGCADVVAVPSREDNMPLTAMEAQSCGRPVVGFAVGGLPDIVEHTKTGYLADPGDVRDLSHGLERVLRASMEQASRDHALRIWSPTSIVDRYQTIYHAAT